MRKSCWYIIMTLSFIAGFLFALLLVTSVTVHGGGSMPESRPRSEGGSRALVAESNAESVFGSTLRSCLSLKCYDKPMGPSNDIVRVGVLSLQGAGAEIVEEMSRVAAKTPNNHNIVFDTNVPAYGYGKNHGWTRIIRFSRNILEHAYHLVAAVLANAGEREMRAAYEAQIRQLTRWHCRLSHVAAHTKMLTVFTEDIIRRPAFEWERILSFAGADVIRPKLLSIVDEVTMKLEADINFSTKVPADLRRYGQDILQSELTATKNLADWPCQSFKTLDSSNLLYSADWMSPNCSDKYVRCSVPMDIRGG